MWTSWYWTSCWTKVKNLWNLIWTSFSWFSLVMRHWSRGGNFGRRALENDTPSGRLEEKETARKKVKREKRKTVCERRRNRTDANLPSSPPKPPIISSDPVNQPRLVDHRSQSWPQKCWRTAPSVRFLDQRPFLINTDSFFLCVNTYVLFSPPPPDFQHTKKSLFSALVSHTCKELYSDNVKLCMWSERHLRFTAQSCSGPPKKQAMWDHPVTI